MDQKQTMDVFLAEFKQRCEGANPKSVMFEMAKENPVDFSELILGAINSLAAIAGERGKISDDFYAKRGEFENTLAAANSAEAARESFMSEYYALEAEGELDSAKLKADEAKKSARQRNALRQKAAEMAEIFEQTAIAGEAIRARHSHWSLDLSAMGFAIERLGISISQTTHSIGQIASDSKAEAEKARNIPVAEKI